MCKLAKHIKMKFLSLLEQQTKINYSVYLKNKSKSGFFELGFKKIFRIGKKISKIKIKDCFVGMKWLKVVLLLLRPYQDAWEYWETLMDEIQHIVQYLAKCKGMNDEPEAQAYLFEFLFRSIRRKLQGTDKIDD